MPVSPEECAHQVLDVVPLVMRAIRAEMRRHALDLSVPQFRVLTYLNRAEGASLSAVAEHNGLRRPSMSKMIDGLVARGLVTRQTCPTDRRYVTLALTARGRSALESARQATQACLAQALASLPAAERAGVARAMQALHLVFAPAQEIEAH
jgi:DNA-binding MarR family transcriptional regulator